MLVSMSKTCSAFSLGFFNSNREIMECGEWSPLDAESAERQDLRT